MKYMPPLQSQAAPTPKIIKSSSHGSSHLQIQQQLFQMAQKKSDAFDDELDMEYMPTIASRSAGMKKPARKPDAKPTPVNTKKQAFDLLDDFLSSPAVKPAAKKPEPPKPVYNNASLNVGKDKSDVDSFFDESPMVQGNRSTLPRPVTANQGRNTTSAFNSEDTILEEPDGKQIGGFKFKRPETAVPVSKPMAAEESEVSIAPSRGMMKPPLRRRESQDKNKDDESTKAKGDLSLTLPAEQMRTGLTLPEDDKYKNASVMNKRRSSIEISHNDAPQVKKAADEPPSRLFLDTPPQKQAETSNLFNTFDKKPKQSPRTRKFELTLDKDRNQQQSRKNLWQPEKSITIQQISRPAYTPSYAQPELPPRKPIANNDQLERQIEFVKRNYQKHIDALQKNLDDQIKVNKESRERLIKESNAMIENERSRMKKIQEEELERVKQMGEWEKKKMEENYKGQIEGLRLQVEKYMQMAESSGKSRDYGFKEQDRREVQYLEERLRAERKMLEEKSKLLDKKELQLEERERDFNKRKRLQEQRLRDEEKRIFQAQMDAKKGIMHERRQIEQQKQQIAAELATIQLGNFKKVENIENLKQQLQIQKREIAKERMQMRNLSNQMMAQYQNKSQQLRSQKNRLARLETDLLSKIKIVQAQAAKQKMSATNPVPRQNNWVSNTNNSFNAQNSFQADNIQIKSMSVQKVSQNKKMQETQNRFYNLTANVKENLSLTKKGESFDINGYLMNMAKYTRTRQQIV